MATKFSRKCAECAQAFSTPYGHKLFCSTACQKAKGNRDLKEGLRLVALIKAHRMARSSKDPATKALAARAWVVARRLLDESNQQDRLNGRMDALTMLKKRDALHLIDMP